MREKLSFHDYPECPIQPLVGETQEAYAAFWDYLKLPPPRSIAHLKLKRATANAQAENRNRPTSMIQRWAKDFNWLDRAIEYDHWIRLCEFLENRAITTEVINEVVQPYQELTKLRLKWGKNMVDQGILLSTNKRDSAALTHKELSDLAGAFNKVCSGLTSTFEMSLELNGLNALAEKLLRDVENENQNPSND